MTKTETAFFESIKNVLDFIGESESKAPIIMHLERIYSYYSKGEWEEFSEERKRITPESLDNALFGQRNYDGELGQLLTSDNNSLLPKLVRSMNSLSEELK